MFLGEEECPAALIRACLCLGFLTRLYSVAVTGGCVLLESSPVTSARIDLERGWEFISAVLYLMCICCSESVFKIQTVAELELISRTNLSARHRLNKAVYAFIMHGS